MGSIAGLTKISGSNPTGEKNLLHAPFCSTYEELASRKQARSQAETHLPQ